MALRGAGKAKEGIDGTGSQGGGADTYASATGVSNPISPTRAAGNSFTPSTLLHPTAARSAPPALRANGDSDLEGWQ